MEINADIYMNGQAIPVVLNIPALPHSAPEVYRDEFHELTRKVTMLQNLVTNHMGNSMRMEVSGVPGLIQAVQRGQKIEAIKALRLATPGLGLKEAKDLIESDWDRDLASMALADYRSFPHPE